MEYRLKDCLEKVIDNRGKNPKYFDKEKYPVIDNFFIKNNYYINDKIVNRYINQETYDNFLRGYVEENMPIMTLVGSGIGNVGLIKNENVAIVQNTIGFKTKENLDPKYLYYWFLTKQDELQSFNRGSGQPSIKKTDVENMEIDLPNIAIQKKIVNILGKLDDKIYLNNQINDNLQKLINNIFTKYFINYDTYIGDFKESALGMIPESFNVDTFGNIITFSNGYGWDSKDMVETSIENSYKIFKMGNINIGGGINKAKTKSWISKDKVTNLEQYVSKKGDILMCMTDMKNSGNPLLGHTALIDKDGEFVINQRVGILRCDKQVGYPYIYTMSNMPDFINEIRSRANSGVQVNLTTKGICDTLVLLPDEDTLSEFDKVAVPLYEQIFNNNDENEELEQLRDTLLPKLMNGEIDLDKIEI